MDHWDIRLTFVIAPKRGLLRRMAKLLPAVAFIMPAAAVLTTQATLVEAASAQCMAQPGSSAPTGSRWYYRIDRVNHHRCWFLSSRDLSAHFSIRRTGALRHRDLINRSLRGAEIVEQSELDEKARQGSTVLPNEQTLRELAAPQFDALTSAGLVTHKVTTISHAPPRIGAPTARGQHVDAMRAGEQSSARGANVDFVFLSGAFATALLVAGGAFQVVGRIHQTRRARQHDPIPLHFCA